MQTGTVRSRGRRLVILAVAACAAAAPAPRCRGQSAWEQGAGGAAPPRHLSLQAGCARRAFAVAACSAEQPWGLPGVLRSTAGIAVRGGRYCAIGRWERLGASGYGEDLLEGSLGAEMAGLPLHLHLIGRGSRRAAAGFGAAGAWSAGCAVSADPLPFFTVEAQMVSRIAGRGASPLPGADEGWQGSACVRGRGLCLVAALCAPRTGGLSLRLGLLVGGSGAVRFALGARPGTGEVSGGVQFGGRVPVAVSWRMHPALGTSIAVGAGVMIR